MMTWAARETFDIGGIGRRLALLLLGFIAYYVAVGFLMQVFELPGIQKIGPESLINALILGLLMGAPWILLPGDGWWSLPVAVLACCFFFGVELIDSTVEDPFGKDRDDLDLERYCATIRAGVLTVLPS